MSHCLFFSPTHFYNFLDADGYIKSIDKVVQSNYFKFSKKKEKFIS